MQNLRCVTFKLPLLLVLLCLFHHNIRLISASCSSACRQSDTHDDANPPSSSNAAKNESTNSREETVIDVILQRKISPRVELRQLEISRITKNMLKNVSSTLLSIDFRGNSISEIENGSFEGSTKLEKIDLMENCLRKITKHTFSGGDFPELLEINLSFNALASIETGSFDRFAKLSSIDLSNNCIRHLHSYLFGECIELREVRLERNEIAKIEFYFFAPRAELNLMDLSGNNLTFVPQFRAKSIQTLNLSSNRLTELALNYREGAHEAKYIAHVENLDVSCNSIRECPRALRADIVRLDVSRNQINNLKEFPVLPNLEFLQVSHNNLTKLHLQTFDELLPSLRAINISENSIKCSEYFSVRRAFPKISVSVGGAFVELCHNLSSSASASYDDYYITEIMNRIQSKDDEIFRQLKLNRLLLVTLLSMFTVLIAIPIVFLLRHHCFPIKRRTKEETSLIEQIEL